MNPLEALTFLISRIDSYYGHYGEDEFFEETVEAFNILRPIFEDLKENKKVYELYKFMQENWIKARDENIELKTQLGEYWELNKLIKDNCIGFNLRQVVEKGLYQIHLEQMCEIMCPEPEEEEQYYGD